MDPLRVLHLVPSLSGGAGRAAYRIHQCLEKASTPFAIESRLRCIHASTNDPAVIVGYPSRWSMVLAKVKTRIHSLSIRNFRGDPSIYYTTGYPGIGLPRVINESNYDLVHLHWCGDHLISIEEMAQIRKPLVWTLHDQWAFCGAEHCASKSASNYDRFKEGYISSNRPAYEEGPDLNRKTWERKKQSWRTPFQIIAPSRWLQICVEQSVLMKNWPVEVIPHPINTNFWKPLHQTTARKTLGLPLNKIILLFGVDYGCAQLNKGADLLKRSLEVLRQRMESTTSLLLVGFGQELASHHLPKGITYHFLGRLNDQELRTAYSAADVLLMPSRVEAFGLTAAEAQACGTPVVAFRTSGLQDVVEHRVTGALAEPFDPKAMAEAIDWVIAERDRHQALALAARKKAVDHWAESVVRTQYLDVYQRSLNIRSNMFSS